MKDLLSKIKKFFATKGTDPEKLEITPYRDWRIIAIVFFVGLIGSLAFNMYMFMGVNQDNFFHVAVQKDEVVSLDEANLSAALDMLKGKQAAFDALTKESVSAVDPSL